jgi:hypothetical protein
MKKRNKVLLGIFGPIALWNAIECGIIIKYMEYSAITSKFYNESFSYYDKSLHIFDKDVAMAQEYAAKSHELIKKADYYQSRSDKMKQMARRYGLLTNTFGIFPKEIQKKPRNSKYIA